MKSADYFCSNPAVDIHTDIEEVQALCGRLDFMHIYAQRKLIFISKISRLNNDVMKSQHALTIFCRFDESMR